MFQETDEKEWERGKDRWQLSSNHNYKACTALSSFKIDTLVLTHSLTHSLAQTALKLKSSLFGALLARVEMRRGLVSIRSVWSSWSMLACWSRIPPSLTLSGTSLRSQLNWPAGRLLMNLLIRNPNYRVSIWLPLIDKHISLFVALLFPQKPNLSSHSGFRDGQQIRERERERKRDGPGKP